MNTTTQNRKIEAIIEKTLVIGIDVGSETHYARAFDHRGYEYSKKPFSFSNTEAGFVTFREWILNIKELHEKEAVILGMEITEHYWFNLEKYLQDNDMKLVLVNPHHVKKSKELDDNNPTKTDRKDPKVIAELVREGRYMIPYLTDGVYADLRTASNMRFQLQSELARIQNRISRWFHIYFPEYKTVYGKTDSISGMMVIRQAPLPEHILALGVEGEYSCTSLPDWRCYHTRIFTVPILKIGYRMVLLIFCISQRPGQVAPIRCILLIDPRKESLYNRFLILETVIVYLLIGETFSR